MIALIDADIVAYRCAAFHDKGYKEDAILETDKMMRRILDNTNAENYQAYLTGSNNFRKEINSEYKANRKDVVKPRFLQDCREYLVVEWGAFVTDGYEADDTLGIAQAKDTVICSIDKDLLQIPGKHYNFVKNEWGEVSEIEGIRHFWKQMLIGDPADNIRGIDGIGPKKAAKLLDHINDKKHMEDIVYELYVPNAESDPARFIMNANCLWILREEGGIWEDVYSEVSKTS